ncbi:helicase-associated domain-containing protein [Microbacterium sp. cf332]|uniref:helicase-associated domain-containing protein n=1 Tax=Microbacterium sp. cf332 TaxID=1761804 RepID=UPI0008920758|nr:helicase-associated domain-containing protein [Microbacterium sp. cf332]SDQ88122.1 Helicase conserved C-terminal domain-containing protein [Microbacterium sp. cf332]
MTPVDARALATWLAASDDDALIDLLRRRRIPPEAAWSDFFDAAEALLDPAAVAKAAPLLSRPLVEAIDLAVEADAPVPPGDERAQLTRLGLVSPDGVPYAGVTAVWGDLPRPAASSTGSRHAEPEDDAQLAEQAFTALSSLADVLSLAGPAPLGRTGAGTLGAGDRRRLIDAGAVADPDAADLVIAIGLDAGLLGPIDREWRVTPEGGAWLLRGSVDRWATAARRLRDALPAALRTSSGGWLPLTHWHGAYPLDPQWSARADRLLAQWRFWAIVDGSGRPAGWAEGFATGRDIDLAALQERLPGEVDRIFLQNDLTAIAPGPLEPAIDARLRRAARRESRAQASTYRFSAESIGAALAAGEDATALAEFLTSISLTGMPQPLAYELERAARRQGRLRVGIDAQGRTQVTASEPGILDTLAVDQALRPIGLVPDGDRLVSRSSVDAVFWMLSDARYPVAAVDEAGDVQVLDRARLVDPEQQSAAEEGDDVYRALVNRMRAAHSSDDADAAWLGRELEQAVKARSVVTVTVRLPDGTTRDFVLEATGLGGGRLRGRDRASDVERTLPVSSIVSARLS